MFINIHDEKLIDTKSIWCIEKYNFKKSLQQGDTSKSYINIYGIRINTKLDIDCKSERERDDLYQEFIKIFDLL